MEQRLAASNHCNPAGGSRGTRHNFFNCYLRMCSCIPAFFYIAPETTYITTPQPYKIGCLPLVKAFALQCIKSFHDRKRCLRQYHFAKVRRMQVLVVCCVCCCRKFTSVLSKLVMLEE